MGEAPSGEISIDVAASHAGAHEPLGSWLFDRGTADGPSLSFFELPLARILQAAQEGILLVDAEQRIVAFNPAAEAMFGCSAAQALGESLERFIPHRHRGGHAGRVLDYAASTAVRERLSRHRPTTALRLDGSEFPVAITLSRLDLAVGNGVQPHYAALVLDLSEASQLRDELAHFKRRLRSVFELAPVAIWIAENDRIVFANRDAERLFGSERPLVGQHVYDLLHAETRTSVRHQVDRALAGSPDVALVHSRITRPDGSHREVEIAVAALPDHGHTTVQMVVADVTQRKREASELAHSRETLRQLSTRAVDAREDERRRIARELHDELGQRLTALKMELSALDSARGNKLRHERLEAMTTMVDETLASVRRIASDLRPLMLDDLGLNAAIEWLARDAARRMGIEATVRLGENDPPVDDRVATALFRMVQEALTNVARHARATDVRIGLRQRDGELLLTVEDNGVGFPDRAMQREGSFGLLGMRERAEMLGGKLELSNPPGSGARLTVRLPLATMLHPTDHGDEAVSP